MDESSSIAFLVLKVAFDRMMLELTIILLLMVILVPAALYDYRERRIPNVLSMSGWLLGPLINYALSGMLGLRASLLGFIILFALTFPFWLLGWMGAGDVKLMGSVGAMIGSGDVWLVLLCIVVAGFIFGLIILALKGVLGESFERYRAMAGLTVLSKQPIYVESAHGKEKETMPYAVPIAFGTLIALLIRNSL